MPARATVLAGRLVGLLLTRSGCLSALVGGVAILLLVAQRQASDPSDPRDVVVTAFHVVFVIGILGTFGLAVLSGLGLIGLILVDSVANRIRGGRPLPPLVGGLQEPATRAPVRYRPLPPGVHNGQHFRAPDGLPYWLCQGLEDDAGHDLHADYDTARVGPRRSCHIRVIFRGGCPEGRPPRNYIHFSSLVIDEAGSILWRHRLYARREALRERFVPAGWTVADLVPIEAPAD